MRGWRAVCVGAALLAGCGGEPTGDNPVVRIYVSEQLRAANDFVRAEQLALQEAGGRAGRFRVELRLLNEASDEATLHEPPPAVAENARRAVADPKAVAFLGSSTSTWTAAAMPITNRAGLLQIATSATYVGLTQRGLEPDEPERYRPSGKPNFARVIANDEVQAGALAEYMRRERVRRLVLLDDGTVYGRGLRALLEKALVRTDVEIVRSAKIERAVPSPSGFGRALAQAQVDALAYLGGVPGNVIAAFAAAAPGVTLFLGDQAIGLDVQNDVGDAEDILRITAPASDAPAARRFSERFRERFGVVPDPQILGAYETMKALLAAIESAGDRGDERAAVRDAFFALRRKDSVFGPYRITPDGDSTIRRYGLYRVRDRKIVPVGTVTVP